MHGWAVQCSVVQCSAMQCSAVQCSAWLWRAGQCSAVYCTVVHCSAVQCSSWLFSAVQCSAWPCIAVQCSVVHGCAVQWWSVVSCTPLPSAVTTLTLVTQQLTYILYKIPSLLADKHFYSMLPSGPTNNTNCWNLARINFFFLSFTTGLKWTVEDERTCRTTTATGGQT